MKNIIKPFTKSSTFGIFVACFILILIAKTLSRHQS